MLSIAGSDSGGGAGIQADLKAFARCGVHGMTAIAALTAQNTVAVTAIHPVPGDFIVAQVRAVAEDIGVDAVKIGMLGTAETVHAVGEALDLLAPGTPIVLDPVMVAESGAVLLDEPARAAIVARDPPARHRDHAERAGGARARRDDRRRGERRRRRGPRAAAARARAGRRGRHRRAPRGGDRRVLRRRRARADPRRAVPGRRGARVGLHALVGAGGPPRPGLHAAGRRPGGQGDRERGGSERPPGPRRRCRTGRCIGSDRAPTRPTSRAAGPPPALCHNRGR